MKNKAELVAALQNHQPFDAHEADMLGKMMQFLVENPLAYHRENMAGHITASAWIADNSFDKILMLHHAKLNKWLQPGGHADGKENLIDVVKSEVLEETGLTLQHEPTLFDIDIHIIPERGQVPEHLHYDVRFLVLVPKDSAILRNEESNALAWFPVAEVSGLNAESSIVRMVDRTLLLHSDLQKTEK